jgi:hypothetical protein
LHININDVYKKQLPLTVFDLVSNWSRSHDEYWGGNSAWRESTPIIFPSKPPSHNISNQAASNSKHQTWFLPKVYFQDGNSDT